jgi:hypothetical protein
MLPSYTSLTPPQSLSKTLSLNLDVIIRLAKGVSLVCTALSAWAVVIVMVSA